ncbi:MAG: hypothetical protein WBV85_07285 [Solirubrobacteraceae bacterium]
MTAQLKKWIWRLSRLAVLAFAGLLSLSVPAGAQTIGYLYSAVSGGIAQFDVGSDTSLTPESVVGGGPATPTFPGSVAMAKTPSGESLYQLAGTGATETIYQYSVNASTGALTPKNPIAVGSVPLLASEEHRFLAVFNPAATGQGGQNALYVLSGPDTKSAFVYVFDIDATTGALTEASEIPVPGIKFGEALAYNGNVLAVTGSGPDGEGFQRGVIDPSTGIPEFESLPDAPCPGFSCDDGLLFMLDTEHMLSANLVLNPNQKLVEEYVAGVSAYEVGGSWGNLGSSATIRPGPGEITANGHEYLVLERQSETEALEREEPFTGEALFEAFSPDGLSEGYTQIPSSTVVGPTGIFALGSGLYIANVGIHGFTTGLAYRLSQDQPPVSTELDGTLGSAMTGFLLEGGSPSEGNGEGKGEGKGEGSGNGENGKPEKSVPPPTDKPIVSAPINSLPPVTPQPPNTKITSVKTSGTKTTIKFKGTGGSGKLQFRCKLGKAKKAITCHSPDVYLHLTPGKHLFSVFAIDSANIADPSPAHVSFKVKG